MNTYTKGELDTFDFLQTDIEVSHGSKNSQTSPYCSVRIIFVCHWIAEIDEKTIPEQLGDMSFIALDDLRTDSLIRPDNFSILFGVELGGEFGRVHQIAKHDRELPSFRVGRRRGSNARCDLRGAWVLGSTLWCWLGWVSDDV